MKKKSLEQAIKEAGEAAEGAKIKAAQTVEAQAREAQRKAEAEATAKSVEEHARATLARRLVSITSIVETVLDKTIALLKAQHLDPQRLTTFPTATIEGRTVEVIAAASYIHPPSAGNDTPNTAQLVIGWEPVTERKDPHKAIVHVLGGVTGNGNRPLSQFVVVGFSGCTEEALTEAVAHSIGRLNS